jgi:hypothetical protein
MDAYTLSVQTKETAMVVVSLLVANGIDVFFTTNSDECLHFGWGINRVIASDVPLRGKPSQSLLDFISETKNNYPWLSQVQVVEMQQDLLINDLLSGTKIKRPSKL